MLPLPIEQGLM